MENVANAVANALVKDNNWVRDCGEKYDFDSSLIRVNTRAYSDNTAYPSILMNLGHDHGEYITLAETEIKGDTASDCRAKTEQWIRDNVREIVSKLVTVFPIPAKELERLEKKLLAYT